MRKQKIRQKKYLDLRSTTVYNSSTRNEKLISDDAFLKIAEFKDNITKSFCKNHNGFRHLMLQMKNGNEIKKNKEEEVIQDSKKKLMGFTELISFFLFPAKNTWKTSGILRVFWQSIQTCR